MHYYGVLEDGNKITLPYLNIVKEMEDVFLKTFNNTKTDIHFIIYPYDEELVNDNKI